MAKSTKSKAKTMSSKDMKKTRGGAAAAKLAAVDQNAFASMDRSMVGSLKDPSAMQSAPKVPKLP